MVTLPPHPNLDHLRRQAKDLLRAARSGDQGSVEAIRSVSDRLSLAAAQLAVARTYGFASWAKLKAEVAARSADLAQRAATFCQASIGDSTGRAVHLLAETPELAGQSLATALVLGDLDRVRTEIQQDPAAATRPDRSTGWTPLHAVCGSRWHYLDPGRASGLVAVARLLLDAGADPNARIGAQGRPAGWSPLRCATGSASTGIGHEAIMAVLLDHGAVVEDSDLFLVCFSHDDHRCLRLLLDRTPDVTSVAQMALSAPISNGDTEGVRLLLDAGADPRRFAEEGQESSVVYAAVGASCPGELVELLLLHGADPAHRGPDGRSPTALAVLRGRTDLVELFGRYGARDDTAATERFIAACLRADRASAQAQLAEDPGLLARLDDTERGALVQAAGAGNIAAVSLLLDLGIPIGSRSASDDGATALHVAAYAGSAEVVTLLLERGADLEAGDTTWGSTPLEWAVIGSGERPRTNPSPDWVATVRTLIEAGASLEAITLSPDDPKRPSAEVAGLLRSYGVASNSS